MGHRLATGRSRHIDTSLASTSSRAFVSSIHRRSASRWKRPWSASSASTSSPRPLRSVSSRIRCRWAARCASRYVSAWTPEHEREHHLHEELALEVRLRRDRFQEPCLDLVAPRRGDRVPLALGASPRLRLTRDRLPVTGESREGRIHLSERQWSTPSEVLVVVPLELVAVTWLAVQESEECHGNAHICEHTLRVYVWSIGSRWMGVLHHMQPPRGDRSRNLAPDHPSSLPRLSWAQTENQIQYRRMGVPLSETAGPSKRPPHRSMTVADPVLS